MAAIGARNFLNKHRLLIIFGVVYVVMSAYVMLHFLHSSRLGDAYPRMEFSAMVSGTAWKPFVYRVLIPRATAIINDMTPRTWSKSIGDNFRMWLKKDVFVKNKLPWLFGVYQDDTYRRLVASFLVYGFLWGYIIAMYQLGKHLFPEEKAIRYFAPIFGMFAVTSFSWKWIYLYDIPVLCLSAACYWCIATRKFWHYMVFFTLACLNKESSIFIFFFFVLWMFGRMNALQFVLLIALQCVVYLTIRYAIYISFLENPGWLLEVNIAKVLGRDVFGKSRYFQLVAIAVMFFMLTFRWNEKPAFLKYGLWLLPPFYYVYIRHGFPGEYRVFHDIMPLMVLLLTHTLISGTGIAQSPVFTRLNDDRKDTP